MMPMPPDDLSARMESTEEIIPRDWTRAGILLAFQPFNWKIGIDRSEWRAIAFDLGCFRFTVGFP